MKKNYFREAQSIHFLGIGGIGVSALAGIMHANGKIVTGNDKETSSLIDSLVQKGVLVSIGEAPLPLADVIVHSLAIPENNAQLAAARKENIPVMTYPEAVGELSREYRTISVCGTHGKSTITALISKVLLENNFDPNVIVGTKLKELGNANYRVGKSALLVLESCEYKRAFLNYHPQTIVCNNVEPDHLDYYTDEQDYVSAFQEFASLLPRDGYFFANLDSENVHEVLKTLQEKGLSAYNTFTYSMQYPSADYYLKGNDIFKKGVIIGKLDLKIPGTHNRSNALAAFAVCSTFGIAPNDILNSLNSYKGAFRRFELKGTVGKTIVIDDYGHHPTEIRATLQAAHERYPKAKICVVFQPHQYSRTKHFLDDFAASFEEASSVIIPNIYAARDTKNDMHSVRAEDLVEAIKKNKTHALFGNGMEETLTYLRTHAASFDVIITMGAGNVGSIADSLVTASHHKSL